MSRKVPGYYKMTKVTVSESCRVLAAVAAVGQSPYLFNFNYDENTDVKGLCADVYRTCDIDLKMGLSIVAYCFFTLELTIYSRLLAMSDHITRTDFKVQSWAMTKMNFLWKTD